MNDNLPYTRDEVFDSVDSQMRTMNSLLQSAGIVLPPHSREQFAEFTRLIIRWNRRVGLVSAGDARRIPRRHLYESLLLTKTADMTGRMRVLDIGSGAGFPGIPLKIWNPDIDLTIIESQRKKVLFLENAVETLTLRGVRLMCRRAEQAGNNPSLRGQFDRVLARAVAPLQTLLALSEPFLVNNGTRQGLCVFPKGGSVREELCDVDTQKWRVSLHDLSKLCSAEKTHFIVVTSVLTNT